MRPAARFIAIGLALYAALYAGAEALLLRHGHANPFYRIEAMQPPAPDWVILGASHAMPLDFGDSTALLQRAAGVRVLDLAGTGTGPLYSRLVLDQYLRRAAPANVLYVADSFAFYSRAWNEDRFGDAKLLARTPWDTRLAASLASYVRDEGVSWRAWLAYASGFAKINNADRFRRDEWEGEAQFERTWRPSTSAVKKRMDYLYPDGTRPEALQRYVAQLERLVRTARAAGAHVAIVKPPVPAAYRSLLPGEAQFDAAMAQAAARTGAEFRDFSAALPEPRYYFDSDHLNHAGVAAFVECCLREVLRSPAPPLSRHAGR